jgi:cobalt ECF transporter T component CbiQ
VIPALAHLADDAPGRRTRRSLARRTADALAGAVNEVFRNEAVASSDGLMQRLDPRVKAASVLAFAVVASFLHSVPMLLAVIAATMAVAAASNISPVSFARKVWASAGFFGLLLSAPAATSWITPGPALLALGPLVLTRPGTVVALRLVCRVAAGAGFGLLVVWTTRWTDLLRALGTMGVPDLVIATLAMTQKQIVSLLQTVENMHLARESRMLTTGSARENRGWVVDRMAFVARRSLKTADDVYDAMLARGFAGTMPSIVELRATARDATWAVASIGACVAALLIDRMVFPL